MPFSRLSISCAMLWSALLPALLPRIVLAQGTADTYPSRPVTLVVSAAAGGPNDIESRMYANKMQGYFGRPFISDFKPGAGTTIGTAYVAKAAPDGYTLLVMSINFTIVPALYKNLSYDVIRDFAPISEVSERPSLLLVSPSFPAKTFAEYIAYAKANPGKLNHAHTGTGSGVHLAGAWLHNATNTTVTFLGYKGESLLMPDLVAGRVDATSALLSAALPMIKAGKIRALAVMDERRSKLLPDLPTIAELAVPGYNYSNWFGFVAPAATPAAIVNRLSAGFARAVKEPDVIATLEAAGSVPIGNTPAQFRQLIAAETDRWRKVVQDNGITITE